MSRCKEFCECLRGAFFPLLLIFVAAGSIFGLLFGARWGITPDITKVMSGFVVDAFGAALAIKSAESGDE